MNAPNIRRLAAHPVAGGMAFIVIAWIAAMSPSGAAAAFPGIDGEIAFSSNRDVASGEVYAISPGGSASRITVSTGSSDPAYSPDGSRIAFISTGNQIFVSNADGSGRSQITTTPGAKQEPTWSPDGTQIAYVANSLDLDGQTDLEIWVINADGSGRTQVTDNTFPDGEPAWSPLGDKIAFVGTRPGDTNRNVYVMDVDGTNEISITPNDEAPCAPCYQGHDDSPAWSPDGSTIAYVHGNGVSGGGLSDIWTMAPDGAGKVNVSNNASVAFTQPAWSPEGDRLAAVGAPATDRNIYVMDSDGSGQTAVDTSTAHDINPDWQPIPVCTETVNAGNDPLVGTAGDDVLCGDARDNVIDGAGGDDILLGEAGNDVLMGSAANDILNGGIGADTAAFSGSATPVSASLVTDFATGAGSNVLLGTENVTGTPQGDTIAGDSAGNVLDGLGGDDTVTGGDGADTIIGGIGADTLLLGGGPDQLSAADGVTDAIDCTGGGPDSGTVDTSPPETYTDCNSDGDALVDFLDACPTQAAATANGCPAPAVNPPGGAAPATPTQSKKRKKKCRKGFAKKKVKGKVKCVRKKK